MGLSLHGTRLTGKGRKARFVGQFIHWALNKLDGLSQTIALRMVLHLDRGTRYRALALDRTV